jgi:tetratricopeptide (TPR) repeat protein
MWMKESRLLLANALALVLLWAAVGVASRTLAAMKPGQNEDEQERQCACRGLDLMMDGDLDGAVELFQQIQQKDPQSPLGYLLEADAMWWRIYYSTANLIDPDVFASTDLAATPYDGHFEDLLNATISKAGARIGANQEVARSYLYKGMAYGLRARLAGLRDKDLPTARAGKKMRTFLLKALERDPNLTDAYLGVGIYNYFVDTLSAIVKILRWFIGLPGGSRLEGLRQLQLAAKKGELARSEAKFYLAKDYSRSNERQYAKSLELFQELAGEYPRNPLWPMLIASLHCRLGRTQECDAEYREVLAKTSGEKAEVQQALHRAAQHALQRMHPQEKIE